MVEIKTTKKNNCIVIHVNGDVDASSSIHLDEALDHAMKEEWKAIIVDCRDLNYISSAGLGVFTAYIDDLEKRDVKLLLYGMSEKVLNTFKILGLDQLIRIVESEKEAEELI